MMTPKTAFVGLLISALVLGLDAKSVRGLIEVTDDAAPNDNRKGSNDGNNNDGEIPFGQSDSEESGIQIDNPSNPQEPGAPLDGVDPKQQGEDKVISDPWSKLGDPDNKNIFGQQFPKPEDATQVPKRPGLNFPDPETESPLGGHEFPGSNGGFEPFPAPDEEPPTNGHEFPEQGGFEPFSTESPAEGPSNGHEVPDYGGFEPEPEPEPETEDPFGGPHFPNGGSGFEEPEEPEYITEKPKDSHHGSGIGGIIGGIKDAINDNKESVQKAVESVKDAGSKAVEAGKDVIDATWKVGSSIKDKLHNKDKGKDSKDKGHSLFPGLWGSLLNPDQEE